MQYNITNASKVAHRYAPINTLQTISVSVYRLVTGCATKIYITFPDSTSVIAQVDRTFAYLGSNVSVIRKFNISTLFYSSGMCLYTKIATKFHVAVI